jgi:gliding motility-associated-like protein
MLKHIYLTTILFITAFGNQTMAQSICLGNDTTVCLGSSLTVVNCNPGNAGANSLPSPTNVYLSDDVWSGVVNIGFTTNFYGQNYTQCVIGSNGIVSFNLANANQYCPWSLGGVTPLPNTTFAPARNAQMPAYMDINPGVGGTIYYQTIGTAPNRRFIVVWDNIPAFGIANSCVNMALVMNEGSNNIDFHVGYKPLTPSWNNGLAIQGTENNAGTVAHITPGRNNTAWTVTAEARRWTPTAPGNTNNYAISLIPYTYFYNGGPGGGGSTQWQNTLGQTFPYNNGQLVVNNITAGPIGYFLTTVNPAACSANPTSGNSDTTWIAGVTSSVSASGIDDICSSGLGEVTATPTGGVSPFTFNWPGLGNANTQTVTGVYAGTYTVQMWDNMGCLSTANVTIGDTPAAFSVSSTIVSCPGGADGTATANMIPPLGNITYLWDDPMAQTTQTAVGLTAGTYNCLVTSDVGCSATVTVNVTEIPGMIGNIVSQSDVTCNSGNDGMIAVNVIQGTPPYTYSWDNSSSTLPAANDLYAGTHTVTVTDDNGCVITITGTIAEPDPLQITFLTPNTQICPEANIDLNVTGAGGSSAYTFTWYENGTLIGAGTTINVDPEFTNTEYCVVLSEACGSPNDTACTLIYFPTPIEPRAEPFYPELCVPAVFEFNNTSVNGGEIATTFWEFGDHPLHNIIELGTDSTSHYYPYPGTYDIIMTVTSIYGCVYTDTMYSLIEGLSTPEAGFSFSANPATIFETTITMQDKSTFDVIDWQWFSPNSNPTTSSYTNPTFQFPEGVVADYPVTLVVTTEHGCTDTLTLYVHIIDDILFYAPNAFTPDGDEHNQTWNVFVNGIDVYDFELFIFNRWGEIVWESHDPSVGWDGTYHGKMVQAGTYQWKAVVKSPYKDDRKVFSGSVSILK